MFAVQNITKMEKVRGIQQLFSDRGIKVTPQRIAVYSAMTILKHACAEDIVGEVHKSSPTISVGTIYNTLDCLTQNGLIAKISTSDNKKYYDINVHPHYHLYSETSHRIEDFNDTELSNIIRQYMEGKNIDGFSLSEVKVQLIGHFTD